MRQFLLGCIAMVAGMCGCTKSTTSIVDVLGGPEAVAYTAGTRVRVQTQSLGEISASGLQLPVVSPDGKWIAYLRLDGDGQAPLDALFTGEGLQAVSLCVKPVEADASARVVCASGAAWPAWSPDSKKLIFVSYTAAGDTTRSGKPLRCDLGIHDLETRETRRISVGLKRMIMPAMAPGGGQVAVIEAPHPPKLARLHVLDLANSKLTTCPAATASLQHLWPSWTTDSRIFYVHGEGQSFWLAQWGPGQFPPEKLHRLPTPTSQLGVYQMFAGLGRPLSPDDSHFAYYDVAQGRIVLLNLGNERAPATKVPKATHSGCWLDSRRFVVANDSEMLLLNLSTGKTARLMPGQWLPRSGIRSAGHLVILTRGRHRRALRMVRMQVISVN